MSFLTEQEINFTHWVPGRGNCAMEFKFINLIDQAHITYSLKAFKDFIAFQWIHKHLSSNSKMNFHTYWPYVVHIYATTKLRVRYYKIGWSKGCLDGCCAYINDSCYSFDYYTPISSKLKEGILVSHRPSLCPYVRLSVRPSVCPLVCGQIRVHFVTSTIRAESM